MFPVKPQWPLSTDTPPSLMEMIETPAKVLETFPVLMTPEVLALTTL
jgi:hypothetical protein